MLKMTKKGSNILNLFSFFLVFFLAFRVCFQESEAKGMKLFVFEEAESIMADKAPPPHF